MQVKDRNILYIRIILFRLLTTY